MFSKIRSLGDDELVELLDQPEKLYLMIARFEISRMLCLASLVAVAVLLVIMVATFKFTSGMTVTFSLVLINIVIMMIMMVYIDIFLKILKTGHRHRESPAAASPPGTSAGVKVSFSENLGCYSVGVVAVIMGALSYVTVFIV